MMGPPVLIALAFFTTGECAICLAEVPGEAGTGCGLLLYEDVAVQKNEKSAINIYYR